ncbi:MAG TPA: S9 family peptidase [Candidatus Dormibacteraeota bacterium]
MAVADILEFRMVGGVETSPDGRWVAFTVITQDPDENQQRSAIWLAPADGSAPARRLTAGKRRDLRPRFSSDGGRLAFTSNREKEWRQDLYVLDLRGGEPRQVLKTPRGVADFDWSPDGSRFALLARPDWPANPDRKPPKDEDQARARYLERVRHLKRFRYRLDGSGQLDDEQPQVWVAAADGTGLRMLTQGDFAAARVRWTPDGRIAFISNREPDHGRSLQSAVYAVSHDGDGEPKRVSDLLTALNAFAFSPQGRLAVIAGTEGPGSAYARHQRLYVDGECLTCGLDRSLWAGVLADTHPGAECPDPAWSADGRWVYVPMTDRGTVGVSRVPADGGEPQPVVTGHRVVSYWSLGGDTLGLVSTAHDEPLLVNAAAADGSGERTLYEPNPWIQERALAQIAPFDFDVNDDHVDAWRLLPPGYQAGTKVPTLLYIHGGPHAAYGWSFQFVFNILAGAGYAVVICNPPGSQTYSEEYASRLTGHWGETDFPYLMTLADKAVAEGFADPERMGVGGASYGGFVTMWVVGHTERFKAAVSMRPVTDLNSFYGSSDIGWDFGARSVGAEPWEDPEHFRRMSPVTYVDKITTPLRIIGSSGDLRTPLEQAEQVYHRLLKMGREVDLVVFHGEPHAVVVAGRPWNRVEHMRYVLDWWDRHLKA